MQMLLCYAISEFNTSHSANGTRQTDSVSNVNDADADTEVTVTSMTLMVPLEQRCYRCKRHCS